MEAVEPSPWLLATSMKSCCYATRTCAAENEILLSKSSDRLINDNYFCHPH